jgi:DNA-binding protein YbaB
MLDSMRMLGALTGLMKNKDALADATRRVKASLEDARLHGESGGGAARAEVTGTMRVVRVELSPALVAGMAADDRTRELAAGLVADAVNDALRHAQDRIRAEIDREAKALGLEGVVDDLLAGRTP